MALIFVVGVPTTIVAAKLGGHHVPGPPLQALALVFAGLFEFVILASLGVFYRRRSDVHKRLMVLATSPMTLAAVFRLPFAFLDSYFRIYAANDAVMLVIDRRQLELPVAEPHQRSGLCASVIVLDFGHGHLAPHS